MNNRGDIEFALRLRTDLEQGQRELQGLAQAVEEVGAAAATSSSQLNQVGETADQQAARIRNVVEASLAQRAAEDELTASYQRQEGVAKQRDAGFRETIAAQNASMSAYHASERAAEQKAQADLQAAEAARQAALAFEKEGQELQQLLGKIDPVIRKLDELDNMEQQLRRARASGRIDLDTFDEFYTKLQAQRVAVTGASDTLRAGAISAGQYQQAMRQLPMQITDITTSLASGMPVWLVAVQQGGQIKDSFGGWANAGRALISTINPLTLAIAGITVAAGATIAAFIQGGAEAYEFEKAIALTGNSAGISSDRLAQMAQRIDGVSGTQRQAAAALAEVTAAGKFTADQIELIGTTAVVMENGVGQAVSATVDQFKRLAEEPTEASAALNEQYNYLTVSVYEQIAALEAQGNQAGAAQLAMESLAEAMQSRATEIAGNLGLVESAWQGIKNVAAAAWDAMLDVGRADTLEDKLASIARMRNEAMYGVRGDRAGTGIDPALQARLDAEEQGLREQIRLRDEQAQQEGEAAQANREAIAASADRTKAADAFVKGAEAQLQSLQNLSNVQRAQQIIEKEGIDSTSEQAERMLAAATAADKQRAANEAEAESKRQATEAQRAATQAQREAERAAAAALRTAEQATRQQLNYVQGLEEQAAKLGLTAAEVRQYDLAERGLAGAMRDRAEAALVLIDAAERQREIDADGKQLTGLNAQLLGAQGDTAGAAAIQIEQRYGELMERLQARGDTAGVDLVNKLINVEQARAQLDQLNQQLDGLFSEQARREQTINTQLDAGLISQIGARQQILALNQQTADEVEKMLPAMRELAAATGDPAAIERLKDMEVRLQGLRTVANEFTNALKAGFETGIQTALQGLADGTMSLQEAATSFLGSIASSLADLAAQQIAQQATDGLASIFTRMTETAPQAINAVQQTSSAQQAAISAVQAAQVAADSAMATSATTAAATTATAQTTAATTTASAWGPAAILASIGSFGTAAAIGLAAVLAAMAFKAFADGGHVRGPGTTTSDSIPALLSDYEFVTRAAVVQQPGALGFLEDFNTRGMSALNDWAPARHNTGGLAGVPAPALPSPGAGTSSMSEPAANKTEVANNFRFNTFFDRDEMARSLGQSSAFRDVLIEVAQSNPRALREAINQ